MTAIPAPTGPTAAGTHYDTKSPKTPADMLNIETPAAAKTRLGDVIVDLVNQINYLQADVAALRTAYGLFLTHVDTGNVTGIGNANHATYFSATLTSAQIQPLGAR